MNWLREYAIKKWLDDGSEIAKLESFFEEFEIKQTLEEVDKNRIKRYFWLLWWIWSMYLFFWYFFSKWVVTINWVTRDANFFDAVLTASSFLIPIVLIYSAIVMFIFRKKIESPIKEKILTKLSKKVYENLEYNSWKKYAFWEIRELRSSNFLNSYERVDKIEDSIAFTLQKDGKYASVQWYELQTSEVRWSWKNRRRVITNHCYLLKTRLPSARINIKKDIFIKDDRSDSIGNKILTPIIISIFVAIFSWVISKSFSIWITSFFIVFWIIYIIYHKFNWRNRVILENLDFEKLFDVHSDDQVESRMIITTAFMDRLVNLVNKTKRKYNFLFRDNVFYVKWNISSWYLEVNTWKKISSNIETFVNWYIEMKEIISFIHDMQILYLSKTDSKFIWTESNPPQYETMKDSDFGSINLGLWNLWLWNIWIGNFPWKFTLK